MKPSEASYYNWKATFGSMEPSDIKKIKDLEDENRRLKQMFANIILERRALKDVIGKSFKTSDKRVHRIYCLLKLNFRRKGKQRLPVCNPAPLVTPEALNQSWSIDFMHDALACGRPFGILNVADDFKREANAIEINLHIPAPRVVRQLESIVANRSTR